MNHDQAGYREPTRMAPAFLSEFHISCHKPYLCHARRMIPSGKLT